VGALGITSLRAWIVAASLVSICAVSHAAGLGKLNVASALGEPLKAEIELVAEKNEIGSLNARLAGREAFDRAGLVYSPVLTSVKVSIEKRAGGEPYVLLTSSQPVAEPFLDLLVELTWSSGRISREFTALLDPPAIIAERARQKAAAAEVRAAPTQPQPKGEPVPVPTPEATPPETAKAEVPTAPTPAETTPAEATTAQAAPTEAAPTETTPAAAPAAPVETIGGSQPTLLTEGGASPGSTPSAPSADAYGPVRRGDTLTKIARATKPADVSLEQMLVLLTRNNPGAFSAKNMNRLKTGKILQLPSSDQLAGITEADARKEVRLQARDWQAYREKLAAAANLGAATEQPAQQSASGKVGTAVEDQAATAKEPPKEVLKLSKNEPATGAAAAGDAKVAARIRALEEEVVARDNAVKESNDRVSRLEKQIKDLQALLEMKNRGMADLQKPAVTPPPAMPQAIQNPPPAQPAVPATPAAPDVKPAAPVAPVTPAPAPKTETAPPPSQPVPAQPKPAPVKTGPAPPPESSLIDQALDQPAYLGAAIGVLIIIGALAVRAVKRRRESKSDAEESGPARAFSQTSGPASGIATGAAARAEASAAGGRESSEEVDPVAEAEIFLAYGRDAQAEELLKEALGNYPGRHEIHLKLLQIYANRKDGKSFEKVARDLQQATGGVGDLWNQAVILGYQVDPGNPRYAAGKSAAGAVAVAAASGVAENVDFNIGSEESTATTTDIDLGEGDDQLDRTQIIDPAAEAAQDSTVSIESSAIPAIDFNVDLPSVGTPPPDVRQAASASGLDFDIDLNALASPASGNMPASRQEPAAAGLDFDMSGLSLDMPNEPSTESAAAAPEIDLSGISLDLGTETAPATSPTGKDDHWYDVQTKFDLAKAYQEMGDKDGAREILKEVLQEGDAEQKTAAQAVLSSLTS
jgi:pilus assembly protein FimV